MKKVLFVENEVTQTTKDNHFFATEIARGTILVAANTIVTVTQFNLTNTEAPIALVRITNNGLGQYPIGISAPTIDAINWAFKNQFGANNTLFNIRNNNPLPANSRTVFWILFKNTY